MNGTYINKKKIKKLSPEALQEGDVLGIGVFEHENDLDFFLFDVLKNAVLKNKVCNFNVSVIIIKCTTSGFF